ncbi:MAG: ATP-dependent Clp protease adaptor ClpS [Planctomycetes bacterium]|nr:ATP-dependent Clp protease adaptor ClpS [Planctomycetota bacterium]
MEGKPQTSTLVEASPVVEELPPYNVVLLDDDDHTYEYVIEMMMRLFGHPLERAFEMAKTVDKTGRVICCTTHKEHAELKREQVHGFGRDRLLMRSMGSMSAVIEPAQTPGA